MSKYVVIDLEMCKVPKGISKIKNIKNEIIQIGAALLDEELEITDHFSTFVKPQFGWVDTFIEKLTGIGTDNIKDAPGIEEATKALLDWMPEDAVMVSWSMTDRKQLERELKAKGITFEELDHLYETWIDSQQMFSEKVDAYRKYTLKEALIAADICVEGREHDGLADAWNTALLFAKMQNEKFELNPYYESACFGKEEETLTVTMGELFKNLGIQMATA